MNRIVPNSVFQRVCDIEFEEQMKLLQQPNAALKTAGEIWRQAFDEYDAKARIGHPAAG